MVPSLTFADDMGWPIGGMGSSGAVRCRRRPDRCRERKLQATAKGAAKLLAANLCGKIPFTMSGQCPKGVSATRAIRSEERCGPFQNSYEADRFRRKRRRPDPGRSTTRIIPPSVRWGNRAARPPDKAARRTTAKRISNMKVITTCAI